MSKAFLDLCESKVWESKTWNSLKEHVGEIDSTHLRELLTDTERCNEMFKEFEGFSMDFSRQRMTSKTMELLLELAKESKLAEKMKLMRGGDRINICEKRAVLHTALRANKDEIMNFEGENVVPKVQAVLNQIREFSAQVREGCFVGATGKALTNVVSIGIGGSYLGPEFVYESLRKEPTAAKECQGRELRFLANVDPIDVSRALEGLDLESTLVVIVSKTFTTAETMLNARTLKAVVVNALKKVDSSLEDNTIVSHHVAAVSTNVAATTAFGINPDNVFSFWDWVGGRYSVCSAVGMLPLALHFGFDIMEKFLAGARSMDKHFFEAEFSENLPVLLGLIGVWNSTFLGYPCRALLPYCQALLKFSSHIQQVDMESNGKRVAVDGTLLPFNAGEVDFGEPGTNGQHSFYQLIHQGRVIPCDFLGFCESQNPISMPGEPVSNHDELMSNFFAQPDALARGKTVEELTAEGCDEFLQPHKVFPGNRPSTSLLINKLDAYTCGQLLSLYEHRTATQGFIWGLASFDQWGVELGKILAKKVRSQLQECRSNPDAKPEGFVHSTSSLLAKYLNH